VAFSFRIECYIELDRSTGLESSDEEIVWGESSPRLHKHKKKPKNILPNWTRNKDVVRYARSYTPQKDLLSEIGCMHLNNSSMVLVANIVDSHFTCPVLHLSART
jgi:hypothetical protein